MTAKTYLITGTSSGFGRLLTEQLLARGDRVFATLRNHGALDDLLVNYGDQLQITTLDLSVSAQVHAVVNQAFKKMGRIDTVISNAGYGLFGAAEELSNEEIDRQIATNLTGSIQLIRAALPHLRDQGGGRIVQLSSEGGQIAYPCFSLYHATKWGIEGFVEAVAQEVTPFGIDFVIVEPGPTRTSFLEGLSRAQPLPVYDDTPVGAMRRGLGKGTFGTLADIDKSVAAMLVAIDADKPPLRLTLGSNAYQSIQKALTQRLSALVAQQAVALSADVIG